MWYIRDEMAPAFDAPLTSMKFVSGGMYVVKTKAQRDSIKYAYRKLATNERTLCAVTDDGQIYALISNPVQDFTDDSHWEIFLNSTQSLTPVGDWLYDNTDPVLQDTGAVGLNGQFYFVTGAPSGQSVTHTGLFGGQNVTVYDGDWIVSVGTEWAHVRPTVTWSSLNRPQSILDYEAGIVQAHTHSISDVTGLQTALDAKFDSSNVANAGAAWAADSLLVDRQVADANFYTKNLLYTKTEVDNLLSGNTFLTLPDVSPSTFSGSGNFLVRVNSGETALEFVDSATFAAASHTHTLSQITDYSAANYILTGSNSALTANVELTGAFNFTFGNSNVFIKNGIALTGYQIDNVTAGYTIDSEGNLGRIRLWDNATERYRLGGTGNNWIDPVSGFGIGTQTPSANAMLHVGGSNALIIPTGTTGQRPTGETAMIRFNSTTTEFEGYDGTGWTNIGTAAAATNFVSLTDTPNSYSGLGLYVARVNVAENGIELVDPSLISGGDLSGGGIGDILVKQSTTDYDWAWQPINLKLNIVNQLQSGFTGDIGTDLDENLISFRNETGNNLSAGFTDIYLGPGNDDSSRISYGNIAIGQSNFGTLAPTGEFAGGRNYAFGWENGAGFNGAVASGNVLIGRRNAYNVGNISYAVAIGYENAINMTGNEDEQAQFIAMGVWAMRGLTWNSEADSRAYNWYVTAIGTNALDGATVLYDSLKTGNARGGIEGTIAIGTQAGQNSSVERYNIIMGDNVADNSSIGRGNIFMGSYAGSNMTGATTGTTGEGNNNAFNTGIGVHAFQYGNGNKNTYVGVEAGRGSNNINNRVNGEGNSGFGNWALNHVTGNDNTGIGRYAGYKPGGVYLTGNRNTFLGYRANYNNTFSSTFDDVIVIGTDYGPDAVTGNTYITAKNEIHLIVDTDGTTKSVVIDSSGNLNVVDGTIQIGGDDLTDNYILNGTTTALTANTFVTLSTGQEWQWNLPEAAGISRVEIKSNDAAVDYSSFVIDMWNDVFFNAGLTVTAQPDVSGILLSSATSSLQLRNDNTSTPHAFIDSKTGANQTGLTYAGDYTANFVDRSLIDKGFGDATYAPISGSGNYWLTSGTTTLTGASVITRTHTATADQEYTVDWTGTQTNTATIGDWYSFLKITPALTGGAAEQTMAALEINPTFPGTHTVQAGKTSNTLGIRLRSGKLRIDPDGQEYMTNFAGQFSSTGHIEVLSNDSSFTHGLRVQNLSTSINARSGVAFSNDANNKGYVFLTSNAATGAQGASSTVLYAESGDAVIQSLDASRSIKLVTGTDDASNIRLSIDGAGITTWTQEAAANTYFDFVTHAGTFKLGYESNTAADYIYYWGDPTQDGVSGYADASSWRNIAVSGSGANYVEMRGGSTYLYIDALEAGTRGVTQRIESDTWQLGESNATGFPTGRTITFDNTNDTQRNRGFVYDATTAAGGGFVNESLISKQYADATYAPISGSANYWKTLGTSTMSNSVDIVAHSATNAYIQILARNNSTGITVTSHATRDGYFVITEGGNTTFSFDRNNDSGIGAGYIFTDGRAGGSQAGIEYAADYSADFTDRSLADWGNVWRQNTTWTLGYPAGPVNQSMTVIDGITTPMDLSGQDFGTLTFDYLTLGVTTTGAAADDERRFLRFQDNGSDVFKVLTKGTIWIQSAVGADDASSDFQIDISRNDPINEYRMQLFATSGSKPKFYSTRINGTEATGFQLTSDSDDEPMWRFIDGRAVGSKAGLEYSADYGGDSGFGARSIIDRGYWEADRSATAVIHANNIVNTTYVSINSTGTAASATGTDAIAIGEGAVAGTNDSIAIGPLAGTAGGTVGLRYIFIGDGAGDGGAANIGQDAIGIGTGTDAQGQGGVAIGYFAWADFTSGVSLGYQAGVDATFGTSIGDNAWIDTGGDYGVALGNATTVSGTGGLAFGRESHVTAQGGILMGYHTTTQTNATADSLMLAWDGTTSVHLKKEVVAASGDEVLWQYNPIVNKTAGNYTALLVDVTETSTSGTNNKLFDFQVDGITRIEAKSNGNVNFFAPGTSGDAGTHTTGADSATLVDSGATWTTNEWVGWYVFNITDGSSGLITANDGTSITATLSGGAQNDWDVGEEYVIRNVASGFNDDVIYTIAGNGDVQLHLRADTANTSGETFHPSIKFTQDETAVNTYSTEANIGLDSSDRFYINTQQADPIIFQPNNTSTLALEAGYWVTYNATAPVGTPGSNTGYVWHDSTSESMFFKDDAGDVWGIAGKITNVATNIGIGPNLTFDAGVTNSIVIGDTNLNNAAHDQFIAIGFVQTVGAGAQNGVLIGYGAQQTSLGAGGVTIGYAAENNEDGVVIGSLSGGSGNSAVSIGDQVGMNAGTPTNVSIAIGRLAANGTGTRGSGYIAIGYQAGQNKNIGQSSVLIGADSQGPATLNVSIGGNAGATTGTVGNYAISIGPGANGLTNNAGLESVALGRNAQSIAAYDIAIGLAASASGGGGIAMGRNSAATAQGAMMFGYHTAAQTNSISDSAEFAWDGTTAFKVGLTVGTAITTGTSDGTFTNAVEGSLYYKTDTDEIRVYNGSTWDAIGGGAFTAAASTEITPATTFALDHATNNEIALDLSGSVNATHAGTAKWLFANVADNGNLTSFIELQNDGGNVFTLNADGTTDHRVVTTNTNTIQDVGSFILESTGITDDGIGAGWGFIIEDDAGDLTEEAFRFEISLTDARGAASNKDAGFKLISRFANAPITVLDYRAINGVMELGSAINWEINGEARNSDLANSPQIMFDESASVSNPTILPSRTYPGSGLGGGTLGAQSWGLIAGDDLALSIGEETNDAYGRWANWVEWQNISTSPANPTTGILRVYNDNAMGTLVMLDSTGTRYNLAGKDEAVDSIALGDAGLGANLTTGNVVNITQLDLNDNQYRNSVLIGRDMTFTTVPTTGGVVMIGQGVTHNTATAAGATLIGTGTTGNGGVAVGNGASVNGVGGVSIGNGSGNVGASASAIAIGRLASGGTTTAGTNSVMIGPEAGYNSTVGSSTVGVGVQVEAQGTGATSIGAGAGDTSGTHGNYMVALGYEAQGRDKNQGVGSVAIGYRAHASATGAYMLGYGSVSEGIENALADSLGIGWDEAFPSLWITKRTGTTSDATANVGLGGITLDQSSTYHVRMMIVGGETDASAAEFASYEIAGTFRRIGSGNATRVGSDTVIHTSETTAGMDAIIGLSGGNIEPQVTGVASTNMNWRAVVYLTKVESGTT